jgi:hypothetical protein
VEFFSKGVSMPTAVRKEATWLWIASLAFCVNILCCFSLHAQERTSIEWEETPFPAEGVKAPIELSSGELLSARTMPVAGRIAVICFRSSDSGETWQRLSEIASDADLKADIGDGAFLQLANGDVLYSYRHNHVADRPLSTYSHNIKVAISKDSGVTWHYHSTVMSAKGTKAGLWSSFLLQTSRGAMQCYFDDEVTPAEEGFGGHQWTQMKTWDQKASQWITPVTVSRAHNAQHLSRDGMASVTEIKKDVLLCALESVQVAPPHRGVIRQVTSVDGGQTWSWQQSERAVIYEPADRTFNALAPWMTRLSNGLMLCVFVTDEDRQSPDTPSTGVLDEDIKYVLSPDGGATWSEPGIIDNAHPVYHAGVVELRHGDAAGRILAAFVRQNRGCFVKRGAITANKAPQRVTIDLLSKVKPDKDAIAGNWRWQDGALISDRTDNARIMLPYQPPEEYDFKIAFTTERGDVTQILAAKSRQFAWLIGHWGNTRCGLELVDGKRAWDNATTVHRGCDLNRRQTSEVRVRRNLVSAYLNGRRICTFNTDFGDLSLIDGWHLGDNKALGLHSWRSSTSFHTVELFEMTGHGKPLR